jgi:peptidoglycan/LPS O-acetylase OafA/YrhL
VGTFFEFLPQYFNGLYGFGGNFAWMGLHLWYLLILFMFSLLLLPVFFGFKRQLGGRILRRVGDFLALPGAIYLLVLPTIILNHAELMNDVEPGGWSFPQYLWFFFCGFVIVSHGRLQQRISQLRWLNLACGLALVIVPLLSPAPADFHDDISSWFWLFAILGFGFKHLNFNTPFLQYANEAVLPFYILHQTVLIVIGYFVLQSPLPDFAKWLIIASVSFLIVMGIYEYGVRRVNVLRFLFGLKPLPREKAVEPAALSPAQA